MSPTNKQTSKQTTNKQLIEPSLWWGSSSPLPKQRVRRRTCRQLWTTRSWTCSKSHPTPATSCLNYLNMFLLSVYHHFIVIVSHLWSHVPPCADSSVWGDVNLVCLTVEPGESKSMWKQKYVKVKVCESEMKVKWSESEMMWKWNEVNLIGLKPGESERAIAIYESESEKWKGTWQQGQSLQLHNCRLFSPGCSWSWCLWKDIGHSIWKYLNE